MSRLIVDLEDAIAEIHREFDCQRVWDETGEETADAVENILRDLATNSDISKKDMVLNLLREMQAECSLFPEGQKRHDALGAAIWIIEEAIE